MKYEEKYNTAIEKLQEALAPGEDGCKISGLTRDCIEDIFPELKENENEKMRKSIIYALRNGGFYSQDKTDEAIAWLEKQDKQTYAELDQLKVTKTSDQELEPKFHSGDWITNGQLTCKVLGVVGKSYELHLYNDDYCHFETDVQSVDEDYHLWRIQDAKDGDILAVDNSPFIYNGSEDEVTVGAYCGFNEKHIFSFAYDYVINRNITPATKEQCDLLFQKIADNGYDWDAEKKKFKKIELKKLELKFHLGNWITHNTANFVFKIINVGSNGYEVVNRENYKKTISFNNEDNYHLWTIADAKDGDLIYISTEEKGIQAIFHEYKNDTIFFHCYLCETFAQGGYMPIGSVELTYPLQKTHYNSFFEKMHKAGYEWDKELKKIKVVSKESEGEKIKKELIAFIKKRDRSGCDYDYDKWIAWLEKQDEK